MPAETALGPTLADDIRPMTRVEQFNSLIRGIVVLAFTYAICHGFIVSKVLSTETMVVMSTVVFTWWFKSRDDEKKAETTKPGGPTA